MWLLTRFVESLLSLGGARIGLKVRTGLRSGGDEQQQRESESWTWESLYVCTNRCVFVLVLTSETASRWVQRGKKRERTRNPLIADSVGFHYPLSPTTLL